MGGRRWEGEGAEQQKAKRGGRGGAIRELAADEKKSWSLRGSNPRPLPHKSNALTTELNDQASCFGRRFLSRLRELAKNWPRWELNPGRRIWNPQ